MSREAAQQKGTSGGTYSLSQSPAVSLEVYDSLPQSIRQRLSVSPVDFNAESVAVVLRTHGVNRTLVMIDQMIEHYLLDGAKMADKMRAEALAYRAREVLSRRQRFRALEHKIEW